MMNMIHMALQNRTIIDLCLITTLLTHFILSSIPGTQFPDTGLAFYVTYLAHVVIFGAIGFWMYGAMRARGWPRAGTGARIGATLALGMLWGVSDELHQEWFVAHRGYDPLDLVADGIGLLLGGGVATLVWPDNPQRRQS